MATLIPVGECWGFRNKTSNTGGFSTVTIKVYHLPSNYLLASASNNIFCIDMCPIEARLVLGAQAGIGTETTLM